MKIILNKYLIILLAPIFIFCFFSGQVYAQSSGKKAVHDQERFEADAAGLAYIQCKYDVTKYDSETKKNNSQLEIELKTITQTYREFMMLVNVKYQKDPELFEKFNREVASMKKQLKTCKKYQNILDANAKIEKMSNKTSQ